MMYQEGGAAMKGPLTDRDKAILDRIFPEEPWEKQIRQLRESPNFEEQFAAAWEAIELDWQNQAWPTFKDAARSIFEAGYVAGGIDMLEATGQE